MATPSRSEVLLVGALALLIGGTSYAYLTMRVARSSAEAPPAPPTRYAPRTGAVPGDECPVLTSWAASPLQTSVGGWIDVSAAATDPDPGESVHFSWLPVDDFEAPTAATTRFRCKAAGLHVITVQVSDDHQPKPCKSNVSIAVTCVAP